MGYYEHYFNMTRLIGTTEDDILRMYAVIQRVHPKIEIPESIDQIDHLKIEISGQMVHMEDMSEIKILDDFTLRLNASAYHFFRDQLTESYNYQEHFLKEEGLLAIKDKCLYPLHTGFYGVMWLPEEILTAMKHYDWAEYEHTVEEKVGNFHKKLRKARSESNLIITDIDEAN